MSILDMSDVFGDLLEDITVEVSLPGSYVAGQWTSGGVTLILTQASPQPASNEDINQLRAEGDALSSYKKFYSAYAFKTANKLTGTEADVIVYEGARYKVLSVADWENVASYTKAMTVKL